VEECPVASPSYEGREPEPAVLDDGCEYANAPSIFAGINFQIRQVSRGGPSWQISTWSAILFSCSPWMLVKMFDLRTVFIAATTQTAAAAQFL